MSRRRTAAIAASLACVIALAPLAGCGGDDAPNPDASSRADSLNVTKPDVTISVAGTNGAGDVVAKSAGKGINVAIHRPADGKPGEAGEKVVTGTTNASGVIRLFAFQPGEYILVGPRGETKPVRISATQKATPVAFAVCVSGCAKS